jgi:hypothetical protein
MRISVEDTRTGKLIKLDVKEHNQIEGIIDIVIKHMGIISAEQRSYTLVLHEIKLGELKQFLKTGKSKRIILIYLKNL